jgi:RNA recognition motif-containing protein
LNPGFASTSQRRGSFEVNRRRVSGTCERRQFPPYANQENNMGKRLYIGNLSYGTTELDLRELFGQMGTVADAKIVMDRETGRPRGFAFVEMSTDAEALKAIESVNGRELGGRALNVSEAQERSGGGGGARGGGGGGGGGRGGGGGGGGGRRW